MPDTAKKKSPNPFYCRFLNTSVSVNECINGFVNANSLNIRHSPCYRCSFGLKIRSGFANS